MSSSVFFRFKSQKEPSRVAFDGTGISVFELKREIITMNKLGDGTDFELVISSEDTNEAFDDDTSIIPRSTTVIAKRLPPARPGRGGAARYVSGKMPQSAKTLHRVETPSTKPTLSTLPNGYAATAQPQTEEDRVAAMFKMSADQWAQQQQEMANATPVHRSGVNKGKPSNLPDHPPPPGYICYRCGEKGHWIMACPTNDDPAYENRARIKRTTGIPRSFLKTIEKPTALTNDGTLDDTKQPSGIMVNAEGDWVVAEPDKATWDQYQAKAKVSAAAQETAILGSRELQDKGLECSIDKRLFVDPTKTPCCQTTFCRDCITNALLENDLRCPQCSTDNIPIDDLAFDEETNEKIRSYEEEKAVDSLQAQISKSPIKREPPDPSNVTTSNVVASNSTPNQSETTSKKRPADSVLENKRVPSPPNAENLASERTQAVDPSKKSAIDPNVAAKQQFPFSSANLMDTTAMAFPNMNNLLGTPMSMGAMMDMNSAMQNPMMMMMPNGSLMGSEWTGMWGGGFPQQPLNMNMNLNLNGGGYQNGLLPNGGYGQQPSFGNTFANANSMGDHGANINGRGRGTFANQQRTTFSARSPGDEDSAYFRKPVNPHRHQARRNVQRPTDYREI